VPDPAQPVEQSSDEMLINISFSVRLADFFKDVDNDQLVTETQYMLVHMTEHLMSQHPHAHLHGDVGVAIQLTRA
jgi:hypothetical protein